MQQTWSSTFSFILASSGAAIGLGTIWYAPFLIGKFGGANCLFLYVLMTIVVGLPILHAEIKLGMRGQSDIIQSLQKISQASQLSSRWQWLGYYSIVMLFGILSFYIIVGGKVLTYCTFAFKELLLFEKPHADIPTIHLFWLYSSSLTYAILTFLLCVSSIRKGVENSIKYMMPSYFLTLIILLLSVSTLPGFTEALRFLFIPNLKTLSFEAFTAATGLAFFTLATGVGCMLNYGAYLQPSSQPILKTNGSITAMIILTTILSSLLVFSITFTHNLPAKAGPDLIFTIIPHLMSQFGAWSGFGKFIFFFLLLLAALTSSISLLEPIIRSISDRTSLSRIKSGLIILVALVVTSIFYTASEFSLIAPGLLEKISQPLTNLGLPIGALFYLTFALRSGTSLSSPTAKISHRYMQICTRFICPCALILLIGKSLYA